MLYLVVCKDGKIELVNDLSVYNREEILKVYDALKIWGKFSRALQYYIKHLEEK